MIGDLNVNPNEPATREESDRILRRYSNDSLRRENDKLRGALMEAQQLLEDDYGNGVDNGYFPIIAPVLRRVRELLKPVPR